MADQASPTLDPVDAATTEAPEPATAETQTEDPARATQDAAEAPLAEAPAAETLLAARDQSLLSELARAMHQAATAQYERLNAELERRRTEQVEAIALRTNADIEQLKSASETDVGSIDAWAKAETEKIKQERLRRIEARRQHLAMQLEHQAAIRDRELAAIEAAIDNHRQEVDRFFGRMERETDPATIAQVAATMPAFPPLAEIAESTRHSAAAEFAPSEAEAEAALEVSAGAVLALETDEAATVSPSRLMAVMAPDAPSGDADGTSRPWQAPYAVSVAAGGPAVADEPPAVTPVESAHGSRVGSTLLRTVRAIRPVSAEHQDRREE